MERTLAEVVKLTGAKRRSVQLWADAGIILAVEGTDRAGTGVHRRFGSDEVKLIALIVPLARWGMSIGLLRAFARSFREAFRFGSSGRKRFDTEAKLARAFERVAAREGHNYLVFAHTQKTLLFDVITDEHKPALFDPARFAEEFVFFDKTAIIGILDLSAILSEITD